jgi:hypothetical protein
MSTNFVEPHNNASEHQDSIDFGFSQYDASKMEQFSVSKTRSGSVKPEFIQSIVQLLELPGPLQTHENIVSMVLEHGEEYQILYEILGSVIGQEEREQ